MPLVRLPDARLTSLLLSDRTVAPSWRRLTGLLGLAASLTSACFSGGSSGDAVCDEGREGCPCYSNRTCDDQLVCLSDLCVEADADGGNPAPTSDDEDSDEDSDEGTPSGGPLANDPDAGTPSAPGSPSNPDPDDTPTGSDELPSDEPHALASVSLTVSKNTGGEQYSLSAFASFLPHVEPGGTASCWQELGDCHLERAPKCDDCSDDEYCGFDANCDATCLALCKLSCDTGEYCRFTASGAPECVAFETFDAGKLAITGGATNLMLEAPYAANDTSGEPWFESGATLTVSAEGTQAAGFAAFEHAFEATTLLETDLAELSRGVVFGNDDIEFGWTPGNDEIDLGLTLSDSDGNSASLVCLANDAAGRFVLPRATVEQALGSADLARLSVSVARTRTQVQDGLATTGELANSPVESKGWLRFSSGASETRSYQPCSDGQSECGLVCINLQNNDDNCGDCGKACPAVAFCSGGECRCDSESELCGEACVDLSSDPANCGQCGESCGTNGLCTDGQCETCPAGSSPCDGECLDLSADDQNCGACGNVCEKSCGAEGLSICGGECIDGECRYSDDCPGNQALCDGVCRDLAVDPQNCGDCGEVCTAGEACTDGTCLAAAWICPIDYLDDGECDCGCGSVDPDCSSPDAAACDYCHCDAEADCDLVDPADNGACQ